MGILYLFPHRSQGGHEGETSEWTYKWLALVLALERGSRATTPTSQNQAPKGNAQGAVAMELNPKVKQAQERNGVFHRS